MDESKTELLLKRKTPFHLGVRLKIWPDPKENVGGHFMPKGRT
jgi:hypothetical protein